MHVSRYYIEKGSSPETRDLSPETSEWLFAKGFWRDVNLKLHTLFDQFEEEHVEGENLTTLTDALESELRTLSEGVDLLEFVRGWAASGQEIKCKVHATVVINDLKELILTLKSAQKEGATVFFEL
jgi:hypothetical protein